MKKPNQKGFTLIELIMVIVILGILSAFALPRFADFGDSAREASLDGARASVQSANGIVRSASLVGGVQGQASSTVDLDGASDLDVIYGYPTVESILTAANIEDGDYYSEVTTDRDEGDDPDTPGVLAILIDGTEEEEDVACFNFTEAVDSSQGATVSERLTWSYNGGTDSVCD